MWDALWTVVVVVVLAGVVVLFIADALTQRTVLARIAAVLVLASGVAAGVELWTPWLPLGLLAAALCLGVAGRLGERRADGSSASLAGPRR